MHAGITTMLPRVAESELPPGVIKSFFSPTLARSATRAIDPLQTVSYLHPGRSVGPDFPFVILPSGRWRLLPYQQSGHSRSMIANGDYPSQQQLRNLFLRFVASLMLARVNST